MQHKQSVLELWKKPSDIKLATTLQASNFISKVFTYNAEMAVRDIGDLEDFKGMKSDVFGFYVVRYERSLGTRESLAVTDECRTFCDGSQIMLTTTGERFAFLEPIDIERLDLARIQALGLTIVRKYTPAYLEMKVQDPSNSGPCESNFEMLLEPYPALKMYKARSRRNSMSTRQSTIQSDSFEQLGSGKRAKPTNRYSWESQTNLILDKENQAFSDLVEFQRKLL
jgi:hypothetical protein